MSWAWARQGASDRARSERGISRSADQWVRLAVSHLAAVGVPCEEDAVVVGRAGAELAGCIAAAGSGCPLAIMVVCEVGVLEEALHDRPVRRVHGRVARLAHTVARQHSSQRCNAVAACQTCSKAGSAQLTCPSCSGYTPASSSPSQRRWDRFRYLCSSGFRGLAPGTQTG